MRYIRRCSRPLHQINESKHAFFRIGERWGENGIGKGEEGRGEEERVWGGVKESVNKLKEFEYEKNCRRKKAARIKEWDGHENKIIINWENRGGGNWKKRKTRKCYENTRS